jgi:hypothetical protein
MSDHDPGVERYSRDPRFPTDWPDETGASVFRRRPSQHLRDHRDRDFRDPRGYPPPAGPSTQPYPSQPQSAYPPPSSPQPSAYPGRSAYAPEPAYPTPGRSAYAPEPTYPDRSGLDAASRRPRSQRDLPGDEPSRDARRGLPLGAGALVGVAGLACLLLALVVLPWFQAGGRDVTRSDLHTALAIPEADAGDLVPDASDVVPTSLPEGVPTPGEVGDAVEQQARDAASEAATAAIDEGRRRYLELYTDVGWIAVASAAAAAVVFSTILTPRSRLLSLLLGVRIFAGVAVVAAGLAHGAALWVVFGGEGAPAPAFGVWVGVGGLAAVLLGCVLGPKQR